MHASTCCKVLDICAEFYKLFVIINSSRPAQHYSMFICTKVCRFWKKRMYKVDVIVFELNNNEYFFRIWFFSLSFVIVNIPTKYFFHILKKLWSVNIKFFNEIWNKCLLHFNIFDFRSIIVQLSPSITMYHNKHDLTK